MGSALTKEEQLREDALFQNRKLRTVPMRFNQMAVDDQGNVPPGVNWQQWASISVPVHQVAVWTADETVQFRGMVLSIVPVPLQDWETMYFILSTATSPAALGSSGNRESSWVEVFTDATRPVMIPIFFPAEYDGFYLNVGETVRLYAGWNDNWASAVHGQIYQCVQGTAMVYFLPTYRQSR